MGGDCKKNMQNEERRLMMEMRGGGAEDGKGLVKEGDISYLAAPYSVLSVNKWVLHILC